MSGFVAYTEATTWLYGKLTTPPISGVLDAFELAAPEGVTDADDVWIVFDALAPGLDVDEVAKQRIWTEFAFRVRAVTRGRDTLALGPIVTEIDNRLHRASGTTTAGRILQATRSEEDGPDAWEFQGVEYRALGGLYHLIVQPV